MPQSTSGADTVLEGNHKHVVVLLLDGLGVDILEKHLSPDTFLRRHFLTPYSSVFPPTTTASTTSMLSGLTPIEHRGISFYVKDEYKTLFASEFERLFGSDYVLFTREEALEKELFGPGEPNANLTGIGDYIAAAVGEKTLYPSRTLCKRTFKSQHAGMTEAEMKIPLIVWKS